MMQPPNSHPHHHHHHHHHHLLLLHHHHHHHHHPFGPFPHAHCPFLHLSPCIHNPSLLLPHHHHHPSTPFPLLPPPHNAAPDGPKEVQSFANTAAAEKAGFSATGFQQEGVKEHEEEEEEVVFVMTDEWREFFAKSEAKRRLAKQQKRKGTK